MDAGPASKLSSEAVLQSPKGRFLNQLLNLPGSRTIPEGWYKARPRPLARQLQAATGMYTHYLSIHLHAMQGQAPRTIWTTMTKRTTHIGHCAPERWGPLLGRVPGEGQKERLPCCMQHGPTSSLRVLGLSPPPRSTRSRAGGGSGDGRVALTWAQARWGWWCPGSGSCRTPAGRAGGRTPGRRS